ncbi:MAG: DUF3341 domain-containing protein [Phycisphaerae bacterium]|nr:DUF3341 domain-containing protein [Phycisphaerae bacterium]
MTTITTPTTSPLRGAVKTAPRLYGLIAEFETPGAVMAAAEKVRGEGYKWWDVCTPFPVHGMDKAMGVKATLLPFLVLGGGITGTLLATGLQIFTNSTDWSLPWPIPVTGYPYQISGKPMVSLPAFIPVIFELTVLLAALTAVFGMFLLNGLPRLYHPLFRSPRFARVTNDRFFVVIEARDPRFLRGKTEAFMKSLNPMSVEAIEE